MSAYNCRIYTNTGFNTINIPDSPALLDQMTYIDLPSLDLNQERFLPEVRVRATWSQVKDADYAKIGDFFYFINPSMIQSSGDCCVIPLVPDYITSAGGPASLEILDGLTIRVHVANDAFGLYGADDPYMAPAYDMDIVSYTHSFSAKQHTYVETTLDLLKMGNDYHNKTVPAVTATNTLNGEDYQVTYPDVSYLDSATTYSTFNGKEALDGVECQGVYVMEGIQGGTLYPRIREGIAQARALGVEQSISGQYKIPEDFVALNNQQGRQTQMVGKSNSVAVGSLPFIYGSANNNRIWYGSQSPYTLASSSGSTMSAKAEEVYDGGTGPSIMYVADPRRTGKPYFRFKVMNGVDASVNKLDFFRGCIAGQQWQSVPLVMTEKSGGLLDQVSHAASLAKRDLAERHHTQEATQAVAAAGIGGLASIAGGFADPLHAGQAISGAIGSIASIGTTMAAENRYQQQQQLERRIEEQQFNISQNVNVPTIAFPADPALFAEVTRNGFGLYRTVYKAADIARIDKILTAFGYKFTKVLEASDFTNRQYFNYIEGTISVGNLPRWWANGIASQIAGGVRVWHVKPSNLYYTNNPII